MKYPVKVRDIHKVEKKKINSIWISGFGYEIRLNIQAMHKKKCCEHNMLIY